VNQIQPEDPLSPHPPPPKDFNNRDLPIINSKGTWYRLNARDKPSSLYFDRSGRGRFDGAMQSYGILYVGDDIHVSWIECYGRKHENKGVSEQTLRQRTLFEIDSQRSLTFADVTGSGLSKLRADSMLASGAYTVARQWAQAIHDHPQQVDGIRYRSRHDDGRYCFGIFDRCKNELQERNLGNLIEFNPQLLAEILNCYDYGLL
jgi:hypothetical protein